ncbi:protein PET100 homolog, mitochondrial [Octopus vulgaris]|uniref:Protein PET100 homolog, mitochondrial n=2 Tax=Octopus TaxID=6643 RepID=A0AA36FF21_OCTVU|nr:protein PET100 homolog, mitochondrial [Octopus sinensis]CAI9736055.1 protein PET100 homolog, mitochondrial [Octopus vulgaris]
MGGWKLEIFKMAVYMSFPVGLFYYFNQPAFFENWMMTKRKILFPQETVDDRKSFESLKQMVEEKRIAEWEKMTKNT